MKYPLSTILPMMLVTTISFAGDIDDPVFLAGEDLHIESCFTCHIVAHDDDFYQREDRKVKSLYDLNRNVSFCVVANNIDFFPEEEASVSHYLNQKHYGFTNGTPESTEKE